MLRLDKKTYGELVKKKTSGSPVLKNCIGAFFIGGLICTLGQAISDLWKMSGIDEKSVSTLTSCTMVFLGAFLTAVGVYDKIAKHAGAGTLVPITGFSNAVVSPAMEFKSEGLVMGIGAKMFIIAGPVIVYGVLASIIYGVIYFIAGVWGA